VGQNTLAVMAENPDDFRVHGVCAQTNAALLAEQIKRFHPDIAVIEDEAAYQTLKSLTAGTKTQIASGRAAVIDLAKDSTAEITMAAIVGMAGLEPILAALQTPSRHVAIANKEPFVAAGSLVLETARKHNSVIIPVDSEHNAIFQCLQGQDQKAVRRIVLTASGGPFRTLPIESFATITPDMALKHPTWAMGPKISIDSATMMNKALEVIEAHHLFSLPPDQIDVVVHPQSVIHSLVEFIDGSLLAQMGESDMKIPIRHALGWPHRLKNPAQPFDFIKQSSLTFEPPDHRRFPAINLAYAALKDGAGACLAMNAANEVAVDAFLAGHISYLNIVEIVRQALELQDHPTLATVEDIILYDQKMRNFAKQRILNKDTLPRKVS